MWAEVVFEEILAGNFPTLAKDIKTQIIWEAQQVPAG